MSVIKSSFIASLVFSGLILILNTIIPPWAVLPMCIAAICSLIIFNIEAFRIRKLIGRLAAYLDIVIIMTLVEIEIFETMDIITIILLWASGLLLAGILVIIFINIYKKREKDEYFSVFDLISFEVIFIILFVGSYFVSGYPYHPVETAASGQSSLPAPTSTQSSDTFPPPADYGSLSESFKCPEDYQTEEEKTQALADFMASYRKQNPASTNEQLLISRYRLLASNSCKETLANMSQQVDPNYSPMISFMDKDFGPRTIEFDNETNVLTAYYPQNNQNLEDSSNRELIFDFFIKGVFASTTVSAKDIADSYMKNSKMDIVYDFSAQDPITKEMDYIIFSDLILPEEGYAVVVITKYSSFQDCVFAVSYSEKISDSGADLENDVNNWFIEDAKRGITAEISKIGVHPSWVDYLKERLAGTAAD